MAEPFFKERVQFPDKDIPVKAYVCNYNLQAYGRTPVRSAYDHMFEVIDSNVDMFEGSPFLIALLWAEQPHPNYRTIDFFGVSNPGHGKDNWHSNLEVKSWIFKNGFYQPSPKELTCENGFLTIAKELQARRSSRDPSDFMTHETDLESYLLEPGDSYVRRRVKDEE